MRHPKQRKITDQIIKNTRGKIVDLNLQGTHVFVGKSRFIVTKMENGNFYLQVKKRINPDVRLCWGIYKKELLNNHPGEAFFWRIPHENSIDTEDGPILHCIQFHPTPDNQDKWPSEWHEYIPIYNDHLIFEDWEKKTNPPKIRCLYCNKIIKTSDPRRIYCDNNGKCKKAAYIIKRRIENEVLLFLNKAAQDGHPLKILGGRIPIYHGQNIRICKNCKDRPVQITKNGKSVFCNKCDTPAKRMKYYRQLWKGENN